MLQLAHKGMAFWHCLRVDGTYKENIPFRIIRTGQVIVFGKGRRPPYSFLFKVLAGHAGHMITQAHDADIKALCVEGMPTVDVRVNAVEDGQAWKILHAEHEWRAAFVRDNDNIRLPSCNGNYIVPSKHGGMLKIVYPHFPAAGGKRTGKKRRADPEQSLHVYTFLPDAVVCEKIPACD